jgi:hypothetical protein
MEKITVLTLAIALSFAPANAQTIGGGDDVALANAPKAQTTKGVRPLTMAEFSAFRPMDINAVPTVTNTPSYGSGFTLLVDRGVSNTLAPKISLLVSEPGTYLARGQYCDSRFGEMVLSSFQFDDKYGPAVLSRRLLDLATFFEAVGDVPSVCRIEVQHFGPSGFEVKNMYIYQVQNSDLRVVGESFQFDGSYQLFLTGSGDFTASKVYLGTFTVSTSIRRDNNGRIVVTFPKGAFLGSRGSKSLIFASSDGDKTTSFDQKETSEIDLK